MIPPHQIGLLRYEKPSPSKPCCSLASMRPFLVITKLEPIANVEVTASPSPMYLHRVVSGCRAMPEIEDANSLVFNHDDRVVCATALSRPGKFKWSSFE